MHLLLLLLATASAATAPHSLLAPNLKVLYRALDKCSEDGDWGICLRVKALGMLDKALAQESPLVINEYMSLTRDPAAPEENDTAPAAPEEIDASPAAPEGSDAAPADLQARGAKLDDLIADRLSRFLRTRTLQFTLPADLIEGRRKKGKGSMLLMAAMAMGGMMIQMAMGKIAMIAGKALLVGKMALLLSAIIGLKKLLGGGGGESHQVVYATEGGHGGGGWGRAHELAYNAHVKEE